MTRWLLTIAVCLACQSVDNSLARDPYHPAGFPPCDEEEGYPSSVTIQNKTTGEISNHLVVLSRPFLDPANVKCWYVYETDEYSYTVHIHKHKKTKV